MSKDVGGEKGGSGFGEMFAEKQARIERDARPVQVPEDELPTDAHEAFQHTQQLEALLENLRDDAKAAMASMESRVTFAGLRPVTVADAESPLGKLPVTDRMLISKAMTDAAPDMLLVGNLADQKVVLVNFPAVQRVMRQNPEYFPPEAVDTAIVWLGEEKIFRSDKTGLDSEQIELMETRANLLKGLPVDAARNQQKYRTAKAVITLPPGATYQDRFDNYAARGYAKDSQTNRDLMGVIAGMHVKRPLTEEELRLLVEQYQVQIKVPDATGQGDYVVAEFVSFDYRHDLAYAGSLRTVYEDSQMGEVKAEGSGKGKAKTDQTPAQKGKGILERFGWGGKPKPKS